MNIKPLQVDAYIRKPDNQIKAFLVYGSNEGLQREIVKKLAQSVCPDLNDAFQVSELNGDDLAADIGKLYGEFNGQSLMGGRRVIIVNNAGNDLSKSLREMLNESQNSPNLLLLSGASNLTKNSSLVKMASSSEDIAVVACYEDRNEDIGAVLRKMGLTFESDAVQLLYSRLSGDRMVNLGELEKLSVYMGNAKNVTVDVVRKIISDASDTNTDDIIYAALSGNKQEAINKYKTYINEGNDPTVLVRNMWYHFQKLLICQASIEKGNTVEKAMNSLIPKIFKLKEAAFKQQLFLWQRNKLLKAIELLYDTEKDCKTTNMPSTEIVSMLLLRLAGAAKR